MADVERYDLARFSSKTTTTQQGFLKAPAHFTRAGVLEYDRTDGTKVRELRPEEEVFHEDSLATLRGAPLVNGHPPGGMVNSKNAKKLTMGWAGEVVERKDYAAAGEVTIMDAETIDRVNTRDLCEISMGYRCRIDATPGEHPVHGRYDQIQRHIRYNHVALGGVDWGRAGKDVGLRLDAAVQRCDAAALELLIKQKASLAGLSMDDLAAKVGVERWALDSFAAGWDNNPRAGLVDSIANALGIAVEEITKLIPQKGRADSKREPMDTVTITIGGVEFTVPKAAGQAFQNETSRHDAQVKELQATNEKTQGRLDSTQEDLKATKTKLEEAEDPKRLDSAVADRVALVSGARKVLGDDAEITGTKREIMEQVLKHDSKDLDLDGKTDDYIEARFDSHLENLGDVKPPKPAGNARKDARDAAAAGGDRFDSKAAAERMKERNAEAWKQPLSVTRA